MSFVRFPHALLLLRRPEQRKHKTNLSGQCLPNREKTSPLRLRHFSRSWLPVPRPVPCWFRPKASLVSIQDPDYNEYRIQPSSERKIRSGGEILPFNPTLLIPSPFPLPSSTRETGHSVQNGTHLELVSKLSACLFWVASCGLSVVCRIGGGWILRRCAVDGRGDLGCEKDRPGGWAVLGCLAGSYRETTPPIFWR